MFKRILLTTLTLVFAAILTYSPMAIATCFICTNPNLHPEPEGPYSGQVGQPIMFYGSSSADDTCCGLTKFSWKWGDNSSTTNLNYATVDMTHTYSAAGTYTVQLIMWNTGASGFCETTTTVTVTE